MIQFIQTVLIQTSQFSLSIDFVYTQLNVKTVFVSNNSVYLTTVPFQTIQFSLSKQFKRKYAV